MRNSCTGRCGCGLWSPGRGIISYNSSLLRRGGWGWGVSGLRSAIDELAGEDLTGADPLVLAADLVELQRQRDRLEGELLRRLAVFDGRRSSEEFGAQSTQRWLRGHLRLDAGAAATLVRTARQLRGWSERRCTDGCAPPARAARGGATHALLGPLRHPRPRGDLSACAPPRLSLPSRPPHALSVDRPQAIGGSGLRSCGPPAAQRRACMVASTTACSDARSPVAFATRRRPWMLLVRNRARVRTSRSRGTSPSCWARRSAP